MHFQNGCTQMSPYSVIVLLGPVIKEIFASRCHSFKIELGGWNIQGMSQICQKITVQICEAKFQLLNKKPNYHPTLVMLSNLLYLYHKWNQLSSLSNTRISFYMVIYIKLGTLRCTRPPQSQSGAIFCHLNHHCVVFKSPR